MSSVLPADRAEPLPRPAFPSDPTGAGPDEASPAEAGRRARMVIVVLAAAGLLSALGGAWLWAVRGQTVFVDMLASALAMCF